MVKSFMAGAACLVLTAPSTAQVNSEAIAVIIRTQVWTHSYDLMGTGAGGYSWEEYFLLSNGKAALCAYDEEDLAEHPSPREDPDCWADWREVDGDFFLTLPDGAVTPLTPAVVVEDRR
ncbi:MAG: hypothetical protein AAFY43_00620 [Pseudomonadota bacterium]